MAESKHDQKVSHRRSLALKLETAGWGIFFIWVGIALLADLGWGAGLFGVGIITLVAQAARKYFALKLEGFWVGVGFLFIVGGVWDLFHVQVGLMPILCIVMGLALPVFTLVDRLRDKSGCPRSGIARRRRQWCRTRLEMEPPDKLLGGGRRQSSAPLTER